MQRVKLRSADKWNNMAIKLEASFDSLFVIRRLCNYAQKALLVEIHAFSYLACLLSMYEKRPLGSWGYTFAAVPPAIPYAYDIKDAVDAFVDGRLITSHADGYRITSHGISELEIWMQLGLFKHRIRYLEGATGTTLTLSPAEVLGRLEDEPQLSLTRALRQPRELLTEESSTQLYRQLVALELAIGREVRDLLAPASLYLQFLEASEKEETRLQPSEQTGDE
jgi:hypothetical protein